MIIKNDTLHITIPETAWAAYVARAQFAPEGAEVSARGMVLSDAMDIISNIYAARDHTPRADFARAEETPGGGLSLSYHDLRGRYVNARARVPEGWEIVITGELPEQIGRNAITGRIDTALGSW